jgi:hypothetical protein
VLLADSGIVPPMKYLEIVADKLHAAGWSWGYCSADRIEKALLDGPSFPRARERVESSKLPRPEWQCIGNQIDSVLI